MSDQQTQRISLWVKGPYLLFVCLLIPAYWVEYGPANFLWGSDIALIGALVAAWTANRLLASMMAVGLVLPELAWNVDFIWRLTIEPEVVERAETHYLFDAEIPLFVRALSMYHVVLPLILVWLVWRLGYDRRALFFQTLLAWIILPITYAVTEPSENINLVFGFGDAPQAWMPGPLYVALLMLAFPLIVYLPTHLLLDRLFGATR